MMMVRKTNKQVYISETYYCYIILMLLKVGLIIIKFWPPFYHHIPFDLWESVKVYDNEERTILFIVFAEWRRKKEWSRYQSSGSCCTRNARAEEKSAFRLCFRQNCRLLLRWKISPEPFGMPGRRKRPHWNCSDPTWVLIYRSDTEAQVWNPHTAPTHDPCRSVGSNSEAQPSGSKRSC